MNVLAVDDSRTIRDMMKLTLEQSDIEIHLAEDGLEGLEVLKNISPDAIITDINMPNLDGFGFIESIRKNEEYKSIPILVLTTESSADLKTRARQAGATGWIVKPFDPEKLIRALKTVAG